MKNIFPGYYAPDFDRLWQNAVFIFDTSVLLNLYRYPEAPRNDILTAITKLRDRVWIPFQVALEFQRNRPLVIAEQAKKVVDVQNIIENNLKALCNEIEALQLKKRHSTIDVEDFLNKATSNVESFKTRLAEIRKKETVTYSEDQIREKIDSIFSGKVGEPPSNQDEIDKIYKVGEARYANSIPPGYMDSKKEKADGKDSYSDGSCAYKSKYGDLVIWMQVIEYVKQREIKHVIFVTDDEKQDWWWILDSMGPKKMGPRPELSMELAAKANVESFYMYNSEGFLKRACDFLGMPIQESSIEQVHDIKTTQATKSPEFYSNYIAGLVRPFLIEHFPMHSVEESGISNFFTISDASRTTVSVAGVAYVHEGLACNDVLDFMITKCSLVVDLNKLQHAILVLIFDDRVFAKMIAKAIATKYRTTQGIDVWICYLASGPYGQKITKLKTVPLQQKS